MVVTVRTGHKGGHGLVRAPGLHLEVGGLPRLTLAALEHTLVVFIFRIQSKSMKIFNPKLLLSERIGTPGI